MMKCGFCGKEFSAQAGEPKNPCGRCLGKCQRRYCPYCGYGNPLVPGFLRKRENKKSKENESDDE